MATHEQVGPPPRWMLVRVDVTRRLPDADARHPPAASRTST